MRALAAALATAALLGPATAAAQPVMGGSGPGGSGPETYLNFHLGAIVPRSSALDRFDTGYGIGGTFGARFNRNVSVEGELGYERSERHADGTTFAFQDVPFTASLRLRAPLKGFEVSGFGGVGLHSPRFSASGALGGGTERATQFGYHAGVSAAAELWDTILFGADARWTFLDARLGGESTRLDTLRLALTLEYRF